MYSYDPAEELHEAEQELLSDIGDPKVSTLDTLGRGGSVLPAHYPRKTRTWFCPCSPHLGPE